MRKQQSDNKYRVRIEGVGRGELEKQRERRRNGKRNLKTKQIKYVNYKT